MVIKESISKAIEILRASGVENPALDARVLLSYVLDKNDVFVITNPDFQLSRELEDLFFSCVQRRAQAEPVAYITGEKEFMSMPFVVNKYVLVPRPDTEHLAELAVELINKYKLTKVADFCTGSGALAVVIGKLCPNVRISGYDISSEALEIAERNKELNAADNVSFSKLDILNDLDGIGSLYNIVVSNPPYISGEGMKKLDKTVKDYEPHLALYGGEDGLDFYRIITHKAEFYLEKDAYLAFEVGHNQAEQVADIMSDGFSDIEIIKDYGGINRVVYGKYNGRKAAD